MTTTAADSVYEQLMTGALGELENERKQFVRSSRKILLLYLGLTGGWLAVFFLMHLRDGVTLFVPLGIILVIFIIWYAIKHNRFYRAFRQKFKATVIPALVKAVDERLEYHPERGLMTDYNDSKLFPHRYDRHKAEDTITAMFDQTQFAFGEIFTEYKTVTTDGKGNRKETWHTVFKGLFFTADFNKHFSGETIIDQDNMERMFGGLGRKFQQWNGSRDGDLIRMENPEFEKRFAVYSTDEQECRYILTPSLMERILQLNEATGRSICLSFRNSNVYLAHSFRKELFEPGVYRQALDKDEAAFLMNIIDKMAGIVEDLNLNTRIWSKV